MKIWHVLGAANALCGPVAFGAWFSGAGQPELAFVLGFQCAAFAGMVLAFCIEERDEIGRAHV